MNIDELNGLTEDVLQFQRLDTKALRKILEKAQDLNTYIHHLKMNIMSKKSAFTKKNSKDKESELIICRFSIDWEMILPDGVGEVSESGLQFYDDLINTLLGYNIEPILCLHEGNVPKNLENLYSGWSSREIVKDFTQYACILFERYHSKVRYWISISTEAKTDNLKALLKEDIEVYQMNHHIQLANASVINLFRENGYNGEIGPCLSHVSVELVGDHAGEGAVLEAYFKLYALCWLEIFACGFYPKAFYDYLKEKKCQPIKTLQDKILLENVRPDFIEIHQQFSTNSTTSLVEADLFTGNPLAILNRKLGFFEDIDLQKGNISLHDVRERYQLPILATTR